MNKSKDLPPIIKIPIFIAGLVFGIFATKWVINQVFGPEEQTVREMPREKPTSVLTNSGQMKNALEQHFMYYNEYPEDLSQLVPNPFAATPVANCGEPYFYSRNPDGKGYVLRADNC